jgi:hypothetical protein
MGHPVHDFDFLFGAWTVRHRRLKAWLANCTEWGEFRGTSDFRPLLGGAGNIDDNVLELPGGAYRAVTLRAFDPKTEQWAIWWLDGRNPHQLDVPMKGGFKDGVGTFLADDIFNGKPIKVRFLWSSNSADSAHWEQAFSPDGGETWETNWEMDFSRVT